MKNCFITFIVFFAVLVLKPCAAETIRVAVASNALAATEALSKMFLAQTGHTVSLSAASTGKLYAQIVNGAPYDVFMAANQREPMRLVEAGLAQKESRHTYAIGRLVLYSTRISLSDVSPGDILKGDIWQRLAIANPRIAPYGIAAEQVLQHQGIWKTSQKKLIRGENIGQAFYFTLSGNVDLGLVALSQIKSQSGSTHTQYCAIPDDWYQPLLQQAVLLERSQYKNVAKSFLTFLGSSQARELLTEKYGYGVPASDGMQVKYE